MGIDKYSLLVGRDVKINNYITLKVPTVKEILKYGQNKYFELVSLLTSTSYQHLLYFHENGKDYRDIDDYTVFLLSISQITSEDSYMVFKNLDITKLQLSTKNKENEEDNNINNTNNTFDDVVVINKEGEIVIDECTYYIIVDYLREMCGLERIHRIAGNEATYDIYIREARREIEIERMKKERGINTNSNIDIIYPLISTLCNSVGFKYKHNEIENQSFYLLVDSANRLKAIEHAQNLMRGIYGGTIDPNNVKDKEINYWRKL